MEKIMLLKNLHQREKTLLAVTIAVLLSFACYRGIFEPIYRHWQEISADIRHNTVLLKKDFKLLAQKSEIEKRYTLYEDYAKTRGSDEEEMANLLAEVESLARAATIKISNLKPRPVEKIDFYRNYALELKCEANIKALIHFIYELQRSSSLLKVEKLRLINPGQNKNLQVDMTVSRILIP